MTSQFSPDPPFDATPEIQRLARDNPSLRIGKRGDLDLGERLQGNETLLELQGQTIAGWGAMAGRDWRLIELKSCKTNELTLAPAAFGCCTLTIYNCDDGCLYSLGRGSHAQIVTVMHKQPIDLRVFANHSELSTLVLSAPFIFGLRHLGTKRLEKLQLSSTDYDDEVGGLLAANAGTLAELSIISDRPFLPTDLPNLPNLRVLSVPAYPELREAWLDLAISSDGMIVEFHSITDEAPHYQRIGPCGEADLLRVVGKKSECYEAHGTLGSSPLLDVGVLAELSRRENRKVRWRVGGGFWTAESRDLESCKWAASAIRHVVPEC